MRINPLLIVLGLIGLFAVSVIVGYVGGQAFLAPAKSASRVPRVAVPLPVVPEAPSQPAAPLGQSVPSIAPTPKPTPAPTPPPTPSTVRAKPTPSEPPLLPPSVNYRVQAGAFVRRENAEARLTQLKEDGFDPYVVHSGGLFKVFVGAFNERENADKLAEQLKERGYQVLIISVR